MQSEASCSCAQTRFHCAAELALPLPAASVPPEWLNADNVDANSVNFVTTKKSAKKKSKNKLSLGMKFKKN